MLGKRISMFSFRQRFEEYCCESNMLLYKLRIPLKLSRIIPLLFDSLLLLLLLTTSLLFDSLPE